MPSMLVFSHSIENVKYCFFSSGCIKKFQYRDNTTKKICLATVIQIIK